MLGIVDIIGNIDARLHCTGEAFTKSCINCYDSTRWLRTRGILRDLVTRVGIYTARLIYVAA